MPTDTIPEHYTTEFNTNWIARIQQTKSRLGAFIDDIDFDGERKRYDRIAKAVSNRRVTRKAPTPVANRDTDFRWAYREQFEIPAIQLDPADAKNLAPLVLPTSQYVMDNASAYHRDVDDLAIATALGSVKTGELGATDTVFPTATQWIGKGGVLGASTGDSSGLTLAKLIRVAQVFNDNDVEENAPRVFVCSGAQLTNLLNTTKVTSSDFAVVKSLTTGEMDTFLGFKFVINNRLPKTGDIRTCVAWQKGAIKLTKGAMNTTIDRLPMQSNTTQIYSQYYLGATRIHDEVVVQVDCDEAAAQPT